MKQFCIRGHDTLIVGRTTGRCCKECMRFYSRRYLYTHPENVNKWKREHRELANEQARNWRKNNPEKSKATYTKSNNKRRYTAHDRWMRARSDAKRRGLSFDVPEAFFIEIVKKPCEYCGQLPTGKEVGSSLDRIDNRFGYSVPNVVPCCWPCNNLRSNKLTHDEMKMAMAAIIEFRNKNSK